MTPRFAVILIGCTLAGAAGAAYHRAASPPVASATVLPPLFMQAVAEAPLPGAWPPEQSVAFYQEMVALLTTAATVRTAARDAADESPEPRDATAEPPQRRSAPAANSEPAPQRPTVAPPRGNDTIVIRDRFGRPIRVERVDRRRFMDPRAYPPPYDRRYGPYGAYAPPPWR